MAKESLFCCANAHYFGGDLRPDEHEGDCINYDGAPAEYVDENNYYG